MKIWIEEKMSEINVFFVSEKRLQDQIELSHLNRQCLNRRIGEISDMANEVEAWTKERNNKKIIADWQFTTEDARIKLRRLYP